MSATTDRTNRPQDDQSESPEVYGAGFFWTREQLIYGLLLIALPIIMSLLCWAGSSQDPWGPLFTEVLFVPLGLLTVWTGIRHGQAQLVIRHDLFEYRDSNGVIRVTRFADVEKCVVQLTPPSRYWVKMTRTLIVLTKDGTQFEVKYITPQGFARLRERIEAKSL